MSRVQPGKLLTQPRRQRAAGCAADGTGVVVGEEGAEDDVGEAPAEEAEGFCLGLAAGGDEPVDVGALGAVHAQLGDGDAVEGGVDLVGSRPG